MMPLRALLLTYAEAGGREPVILVHDGEHGEALIDALARFGAGLPANVLPIRINEVTQTGLDAQIVEYERRGELSAGEALLLRSALVRESVDDARARAEQVAALDRQYRAESDRRRGEWAAQRDPMFELYKLREAAIVENVMAMAEIPDGLSRNEYLRRKLQEERELLFDGG